MEFALHSLFAPEVFRKTAHAEFQAFLFLLFLKWVVKVFQVIYPI
jgi:hypothetical protein